MPPRRPTATVVLAHRPHVISCDHGDCIEVVAIAPRIWAGHDGPIGTVPVYRQSPLRAATVILVVTHRPNIVCRSGRDCIQLVVIVAWARTGYDTPGIAIPV